MATPDGGGMILDNPGNVPPCQKTPEPNAVVVDGAGDKALPNNDAKDTVSASSGVASTESSVPPDNGTVEKESSAAAAAKSNSKTTFSDCLKQFSAKINVPKTTSAPKTPWKILFSEADTVKKLKLLSKDSTLNHDAPEKSSGKTTVNSVFEAIVEETVRPTRPMQPKVAEVTASELCQKPTGNIQTTKLLVDISSATESIVEEAMQPNVSEVDASESDLDPTGIETTKLLVDFERNTYVCKSCGEFEERDEDLFRKHIWQEVHPDGECSHTGSTHGPGMDNADGCSHINNLMHKLHAKKQATDGQAGSENDVKQMTSGTTLEIAGDNRTTSGTPLTGEDHTAAGTKQRTDGDDETLPGTTQRSAGEDQTTSGITTKTAEDDQTSTQRAVGEDEAIAGNDKKNPEEDETTKETAQRTSEEEQTPDGTMRRTENQTTSGTAETAGDDVTTVGTTHTTKGDDQTSTGTAKDDPTTNGIAKVDQTTTGSGDVTSEGTVQNTTEGLPAMSNRKPTRAAARAAMSKLHQQIKNVYVVENEESSPDNSGDEDYAGETNIVDESSADDGDEVDMVEGSSKASNSRMNVERDDHPVPDISKKSSSSNSNDGIASDKLSSEPSKQYPEPTPLQLMARPRRGRPLTHFAPDAISMNNTVHMQSKTVLKETTVTKSIDHNKRSAKTTGLVTKSKEKSGDKGDDSDSESDTEEEGDFFKCRLPTCGQSFPDVAGLRKHVQQSHKSMTLFPCPYCSCLWSDYNRLIEHIPAHVGPKPYRCVQCDVCYKKDASLRKHFKKSHHVNKQFTCTFDGCEYVTNLWTDFKVHSLSYHSGEKQCTCFACDATFPSMSDYFLHVESGMETLICCSLCTMKAKMRHTIIRHSGSVHQGVKNGVFVQTTVRCAQSVQTMQPIIPQPKRTVFVPVKRVILHECSRCDFADGNKASYDKHVRSHELNEKLQFAFSCELCRFGSSDRMQYKMHIANHRKTPVHQLRCFKCTHCTFATNQMKMIEKHLQEMHKERPFKFEVQQEVVISNGQNKSALSDVQPSDSRLTPKTVVTLPKSGKSPQTAPSGNTPGQTAPSGNAIKKTTPSGNGPKAAALSSRTPASKTQQAKARQHRRTKRPHSDDDDFEDDGNNYHPHKRIKSVKKPEPARSANTDGLRRSSRITTPVRIVDAENVIACLSSEADEPYDTDELPPTPAINAVASKSAVIDRFHCDLCQFACSDWQLFHDHVQSLHGNSTQWSNINVSAASVREESSNTAGAVSGKYESASAADVVRVKAEPADENASSTLSGGTPQEQRYYCNLCSTVCQEWESFEMHMEAAHAFQVIKTDEAFPFQNIMATPIQKPMRVNRNGQFTCQNCQFSTTSKSNMWKHNKMHSLKLKAGFKCMYCSYSSPQKFVITRHVQSSHPDKPSDQTHVVVLQSRKTPTISLDAVEQPSKSSQKNVGSENQGDDTLDMADPGETKTHSDDDPEDDDMSVDQTGADCSGYCTRVDSYDLFQCKQCEFMHRFPSKVLRHFNYRHTKHCPYKCAYCDFRSVESGKVKRHCSSAHRGQPPTVIKVEGDASTSDTVGVVMSRSNKDEDVETEDNDEDEPDGDDQSWWRRYVKTSDNQMISCTLCGYQQVGMSALKRHVLAIHLGFTPFACKYCDFSTMEIRKVREHIKKMHPGLACKVIRRKYSERQQTADSVVHGIKVGHTSSAVGQGNTSHGAPSCTQSEPVDATATGRGYIGVTSALTDTPIAQGTEVNNVSMLSTTVLNVKPEPLSNDTLNVPRRETQHIKFYKCIYCDFCSEDRFDDIRDHIFVAHLHRNHFNCVHCEFGSMTKGDVISHCVKDHPGQDQKVNEDREYSRSISILETHGDVLLVGMLSKDNVPLIELPKNLQADTPYISETHAPKASEVTHLVEVKTSSSNVKSSSVNVKSTGSVLGKKKGKKGRGLHTCKKCGFTGMWYITVGNHILRTHLNMHCFGCTYCSVEFDGYKRMRNHIKSSHPRKKMCISYNAVKHRKRISPYMKTPADCKKRSARSAPAPSAPPKSHTHSQKKQESTSRSRVFGLQKKSQSGTHNRNRSTTAVCDERVIDDATSTCSDTKSTKSHSSTGCNDAPSSGFLWKCTTCGTKLAMLEAMRIHVLTQHLNLQPFQCAVCDFGESSTDLVETHIREMHQHSRIHIPVMDVVAEKADGLKKEMIRVRAKKTPVLTDTINSDTFDCTHTIGKSGESVYKCNLCDHEVKSKSKMLFHYKTHAQFRSYGCGYCAYKAVNKFFVQKHINKVHAGRSLKYHFSEKAGNGIHDDVEIPTSGAESGNSETTVLSTAGQYTASKRMSPRDKGNAQDVIPTMAASNSEFVMPSSVGSLSTDDCQKPMYACLMCGKTKLQQQSVQHHVMADHLKYKPYRCKYCKHTGTNRRCVRDHIISKHAGKPISISYKRQKKLEDIVNENVIQAINVSITDDATKPSQGDGDDASKRPQTTDDTTNEPTTPSNESFTCVLCKGYSTCWKFGMLRHITREIEYSPFECPYCSYRTNRQDEVRQHVKTNHPDLKVTVKFNKNEAKENRALELLEMSVVARDAGPASSGEQLPGDSTGGRTGYKRGLVKEERSSTSPLHIKVRRPGSWPPGTSVSWEEDEFQPSVRLVDVMRVTSLELKRLLVKQHFANVSILF